MTPLDHALAAIPADTDAFTRARAHATMIAYAALWDMREAEVLAVEREFCTPYIRPDGTEDSDWDIAGKIDLVLRSDGAVRLFDHKTSSEDVGPGSTFRGRLALHRQPAHYLIGARSLGIEAVSFTFDVIGKLGIEPLLATPNERRKFTKKGDLYANQRAEDETVDGYFRRCADEIAEDPERYFAEIEVVRNHAELEEHVRDIHRLTTQIDTVRHYGLAARNDGACFQYGGRPCSYHGVCSGTASVDDVRLFTIRKAHEELATKPREGRRLITVSRMGAFLSCQTRHDLRYERGIAPVERAEALAWGTLVHSCAEHYWRARAPESVRNAA